MAIIDPELLGNTSISDKVATMLQSAAQAETDLRCSFDWAGSTSIPCVGGPQFDGKDLDIAGWVKRRKVKIKVRTSALPDPNTRPAENHTLVYRASYNGPETRYRIKAVKNWFDAILELECEDANT